MLRFLLLTIPVNPGRNLAIIIETAAMNNRQKKWDIMRQGSLAVGLGMEDIKPGETELEIWKNSPICRLIKNILEK